MSSLREKLKMAAKNLTERRAPLTNPSVSDRLRGYQILRLSGGSPPTNVEIRDRVAWLQHRNRFLHVTQYTNANTVSTVITVTATCILNFARTTTSPKPTSTRSYITSYTTCSTRVLLTPTTHTALLRTESARTTRDLDFRSLPKGSRLLLTSRMRRLPSSHLRYVLFHAFQTSCQWVNSKSSSTRWTPATTVPSIRRSILEVAFTRRSTNRSAMISRDAVWRTLYGRSSSIRRWRQGQDRKCYALS